MVNEIIQKKQLPSMAQIAVELGLSRKTVSCIINGRIDRIRVSDATVKRVLEYCGNRGYVQSRYACGLRDSSERIVGVLHLDDIRSHMVDAFNLLIRNMNLANKRVEIMVPPRASIAAAVRELVARRVTDLIWVHNGSLYDFCDQAITNYLVHMRMIIYNFPFKMIPGEAALLERGASLVGVDRPLHIKKLAKFLYSLGHRGVILPNIRSEQIPVSYRDAFEGSGLRIIDVRKPCPSKTLVSMMKSREFTVAYYHADAQASQAVCELRALGVRIPQDLTVVGFDGMSRAFFSDLTTLEMPIRDMVGRVEAILDNTQPAGRHCFDLKMIKGRTHGRVVKSEEGRVNPPRRTGR